MVLKGRREAPGDRLSVPRGTALRATAWYDPEAFGRFSEGIARFFGTGKYLVGQTIVVVIWIIVNSIGFLVHWDPYPFILLNLVFSTQAAYAAPLILLAQNRQDERDRLSIERDREVAARTQADTEFLARELTAVRLSMADTVTNEDLDRALERVEQAMARIEARLEAGLGAGPGGRAGTDSEEGAPGDGAPRDGVPRDGVEAAAVGSRSGPEEDPPSESVIG